jgi:5,5'-dehydrodivanillate O-demethylase
MGKMIGVKSLEPEAMAGAVAEDAPATTVPSGPVKVRLADIEKIGPGTLNGRYMRQFWHPVFHAADIEPGHIKPLRILGEDFVLFRSDGGVPQVMAPRCPHRGMSLVAGWVEGETLRCFYHGWRFDQSGQCVEQPAEKDAFCKNIKTRVYPTREYLGLIFAYLGEGEAPEFPRYPAFEEPGISLHTDSYTRACGFYNNMENAGDLSHVAFAHRDASVSWDERVDGPVLTCVETCWGVENRAERPSGRRNVGQVGMPNKYHVRGVPDDPEVQFREFIGWWVPHDDDRHTQFTVVRVDLPADAKARYYQRRKEMLARQDLDREAIARAVLAGEMRLKDVDPTRLNLIFLQDDIAQPGVGPIATRVKEHLGRGDVSVVTQRRIWLRELRKFANGEPTKQWKYDPEVLKVHADYR